MRTTSRVVNPFVILLTIGLLIALFIPLATRPTRAGQQTVALAPGDQLAITCETGLDGTVQGTLATIQCAPSAYPAPTSAQAGPVVTGFNGVQEGQAISGKVAIEALVTGDNIAQVVFQLDGPQPAIYTDKRKPYFFLSDRHGKPRGWDTTQYPDGNYTLTATATEAAGQSSTQAIHFSIANGSQLQPTEPTPEATEVASPEPPPQPAAPSGPAITGFKGVQEGQALSGKVAIEAIVSGDNITQVAFQLDGPKSLTHTERQAPYFLMGDNNGMPNGWDTTQLPNADYTLMATATNGAGQSSSLKVHFPIVNNAQLQPTTIPNPTAPPAPASILWSADHETGDMSQWYKNDCGGEFNSGGGRSGVTSQIAHSGSNSAALTISNVNGDQGVRLFRWCEANTHDALYYSVWYYFPTRFDAKAGWWNIFQWKSRGGTCDNCSGIDPLWILDVANRPNGANYLTLTYWPIPGRINYRQDIADIPVGRWFNIEAYYKKSTGNSGQVIIWQDGVEIFNKSNVQTAFNNEVNWSINNYTSLISPDHATIYVDDAIISTTRVGS